MHEIGMLAAIVDCSSFSLLMESLTCGQNMTLPKPACHFRGPKGEKLKNYQVDEVVFVSLEDRLLN